MHRSLLAAVCSLLLVLGTGLRAADSAAEASSFSVFPKIDPAKLAKGEVMTARGPASPIGRQVSVQSCYVVMTSPAKALEALQQWDPSKHREMKIFLHADLPGSPKAGDFSRLSSAPGNASVRALVAATEKLGPQLQISREEAKKTIQGSGGKDAFPEPVKNFWAEVLANRASLFTLGGASRQPSYDHAAEIRPGEEFAGLIRGQDKIKKQFSPFLGESGVLGGKPSLKEELYYEVIEVEDEGVIMLGAFASKPVGSGFQAADILYYASGGYYVGLTLYQMWPIDVGGQPATLVWRGDLISAASLASLHGMEKLASESAMMKDILKAVNFLKRDTAGGR